MRLYSIAELQEMVAKDPNARCPGITAIKAINLLKFMERIGLPMGEKYYLANAIKQMNENRVKKKAPVRIAKRRKYDDNCPISLKRTRSNNENTSEIRPVTTNDNFGQYRCVICLDNPRERAFLHKDTAHVCLCASCALTINTLRCPVCSTHGEKIIKVFWP